MVEQISDSSAMDPRVSRSLIFVFGVVAIGVASWFSMMPPERVMKEVLSVLPMALFWLVYTVAMLFVDYKDGDENSHTYADPVDLVDCNMSGPSRYPGGCSEFFPPGPRRPTLLPIGHYMVLYAACGVLTLSLVFLGLRVSLSLPLIPTMNEVRCLLGVTSVPSAQGDPCKEYPSSTRPL